MTKYIAPQFELRGFTCPHCQVYAQMEWESLINPRFNTQLLKQCICTHCRGYSIWKGNPIRSSKGDLINTKWNMVYPITTSNPAPHEDMPDNVKEDYDEASSVFQHSPRAAAALLRLALQRLCVHLGEPGKNINDDIRSLAAKHVLPNLIIKIADTIRITGNNAVHPGQMNDEDVDQIAEQMFGLLNLIVDKGIAEPKRIEELYLKTPESARKAAEEKDNLVKE